MKLKLTLFILAVLILAGFAPQFSQSATAIICRFEATPCVSSWNGNDVVLYSDQGSTQKVSLEGSAGTITMAGYEVIQAQTALSLTNAGILTPTGSFQPIEAAGNVTVTLAAASGYAAGAYLQLINTANVTIVITDTGNAILSGNISLGQYDAATLVGDGTRWIQMAESDN